MLLEIDSELKVGAELVRAVYFNNQTVMVNPRSIFTNNEQGVWYDPSDRATLFQDSAGTTPVTAIEQPVGLMLDKRLGLVLGPEMNPDVSFDNPAAWTVSAGVMVSGGVATFSSVASGGSVALAVGTLIIGRFYRVSFDVVSCSAGGFGLARDTSIGGSTEKTYVGYFRAAATTDIRIRAVGTTTGTIDNISVRELPGNHAFQATAASRPVLSARYNQFEATEDISNAYWIKTRAVASAANRLREDSTAASTHYLRKAMTVVGSTAYTIRVELKADGRNWVTIGSNAGSSALAGSYFNLSTGTKGSLGTSTSSSIESLGDGWYACTVVVTTGSAVTALNADVALAAANGTIAYDGDGTSGVLIRKLDFRVSNDGVGLPPYQRVNTATDYDTAGFKPYLLFDRTDDWMQTNSINFTATDKMTVFVGVRKLSDSATAVVVELSASSTANTGTFLLSAPRTPATADYSFRSFGTTLVEVLSPATFASPDTSILTGVGNISGDQTVIRVNGSQSTNISDQGTGNYGNYPLYIGRRGGTTLPFNGRLYGLIVRGAQSTAQDIANIEKWMNKKTGAY